MHSLVLDAELLATVLQIIAIDILLGGDNAVVIALACRRLPPALRGRGIFWGAFGAVAMRFLFVFFTVQLLALPYLKLIGGVLLLWIGIKLLLPQDEENHENIPASTHLLGAIRTIIVADAVMSLDNVVAIAGAADGHLLLVAIGVLISVPVIVWGSRLVLALMERLPMLVMLGAALLGWIAGGLIVEDHAVGARLPALPQLHWFTSLAGAAFVVLAGLLLARRQRSA